MNTGDVPKEMGYSKGSEGLETPRGKDESGWVKRSRCHVPAPNGSRMW